MTLSVIVCTYRRIAALRDLLECLPLQTYKDFEVLIVDGNDVDWVHAGELRTLVERFQTALNLKLVYSKKGLAHQRNVGIDHASGELICFLDDDVVISADFLWRVNELLTQRDTQGVGGITGYDRLHFSQAINFRWKIRRMLRIVPSLTPGAIDRFGRSIPASFAKPFSGCRQVGYLSGFCMIYRRRAIGDLRFDEELPTYAGEDRDFSFRLGQEWRLLMCGDLQLEHRFVAESRDNSVDRTYQAGFGIGRGFAKSAAGVAAGLELLRVAVCEFLVDMLAWASSPSLDRLKMPFVRVRGFLMGFKSLKNRGSSVKLKVSEI
jgi:glycosyltransferase involved in cell wall biosynthesis